MEEAAALATRAAIISRRILTLGTIGFLCKKYGNAYHVHMILKSAPTSTQREIEDVESWVLKSFSGARLDPFGNYHGQIKFSVPATTEHEHRNGDSSHESNSPSGVDAITFVAAPKAPQRSRNIVAELFYSLEKHKEAIGLEHYSVGATTLDDVFLNVVRENNVREEGSAPLADKRRRVLFWV
jgi:ATP-binding cassette, subfamily A (ABC1), member 3